jgi:hypothetical protein
VHPRSLSDAFADVRATWGDEAVMNALMSRRVDTSRMKHDDFVSTFDTATMRLEAASAVSEFGHDEPKARTVSRWTRIKRYVRAAWVAAFYRP